MHIYTHAHIIEVYLNSYLPSDPVEQQGWASGSTLSPVSTLRNSLLSGLTLHDSLQNLIIDIHVNVGLKIQHCVHTHAHVTHELEKEEIDVMHDGGSEVTAGVASMFMHQHANHTHDRDVAAIWPASDGDMFVHMCKTHPLVAVLSNLTLGLFNRRLARLPSMNGSCFEVSNLRKRCYERIKFVVFKMILNQESIKILVYGSNYGFNQSNNIFTK